MRRPLVLVVALALLFATACGGSHGGSNPPGPGPSTLSWGPCTAQAYQGHYRCATLEVPMDYSGRVAGKLSIALIETPATDRRHRIGSLLVNPGGPGESAVENWDFLSTQIDPALHERFDVIGFDPRGVGRSTAVTCLTGPELDTYTATDLAPTTPAQVATLEAEARTVARTCASRQGALLPFVGTENAARDMDRIRAAVGDQRLTYLGFSYGTLLGATYAQEFPTHVRALVLDGALDPALAAIPVVDEQSRGFQAQLDAFLAQCAGSPSCPWKITGDPHAALRALRASILASPLATGTARRLTVGNAFLGIGVALYSRTSWPVLQIALGQAARGDGSDLLTLSDEYAQRSGNGTYSNATTANLAIDCRDYGWPRTTAAFLAAEHASVAVAPDFGPANLGETFVCSSWPADASGSGAPGPLTARGAPPILVVATTGDPATPYAEGVALSRELSSGVLLTNVGEQHTAYGFSECVRRIADAYLIDARSPGPRHCDDE